MEGNDVTLGLAFIAGLISFISPCVLPLVPAYIGYMGGRMTQQTAGAALGTRTFRQRFGTFTHGVFFVLGFTLFFVVFGLLTTAAVSSLTSLGMTEGDVRDTIARVGGTAVILFGLHIMGVLNRLFTWLIKQAARLDRSPYGNLISALVGIALIGVTYWLFVESWFLTLVAVLVFTQVFRSALKTDTPGQFWSAVIVTLQTALYTDTRRQAQPTQRYGYFGSMFMGIVFSAGWTPCIGPIYAAVLTLASTGESVSKAGVLMAVYALGLGIPFLLTALALDQMQGVFRRLQRNMRVVEQFSGVFLILIGVLVFSGRLERITQVGASGGSLGDISLNLENCVVGAFEGKVRAGNVLSCISDGPKQDFYVAEPKGVAAVPAASDTTVGAAVPSFGDPGETSQGVPALGASGESVPDLGSTAVEGLRVGQRAPDFTTQTLDGQTVSLSDFRGQVVLVNFWATWCEPCRDEMPEFQTIYDLHKADGFVVLAVNSLEPEGDVAVFIEKQGFTFPVLLDESGAISERLYGSAIPGNPTSFLLRPDGTIAAYFPGQLSGARLLEALEPLLQN